MIPDGFRPGNLNRRSPAIRVIGLILQLARVFVVCILILKTWPVVGLESRSVRILATSDLHGWLSTSMIYPGQKRKGLLHIRELILRARSEDPGLVLLDAGDLLQGSPLVYYHHRFSANPAAEDPFFKQFLELEYDAVAVGNHDLGIQPLLETNYLPASNFSWLAANIRKNNKPLFRPYLIIKRSGLKIAVVGFSTSGSKMWLNDSEMKGIQIEPPEKSAEYWLSVIKKKEKPDLVIGLFHAGVYPVRDDENSKLNRIAAANAVINTLKQNRGFDLVIAGHDHRLSPYRSDRVVRYIEKTPVVEGGKWGEAVVDLNLKLNRSDSGWQLTEISSAVKRARQDKRIDHFYQKLLPADYLSFLRDPLPYTLGSVSRSTALECFNQINALAHDEPGIAGSMLPKASIYRLSGLIGKQLCRQDLFNIFRHDNKTVTIHLSSREIHLLKNPEPEFGSRRIYGNRRLYAYLKRTVETPKDDAWWLRAKQFDSVYLIKISDYHYNGGGGLMAQVFLQKAALHSRSSATVREQVYDYLKSDPLLPESCRFLKHIGSESSRSAEIP